MLLLYLVKNSNLLGDAKQDMPLTKEVFHIN